MEYSQYEEGALERTDCIVSFCYNGQLHESCDKECPSECKDDELPRFNLNTCSWNCIQVTSTTTTVATTTTTATITKG